eukprot:TRINITY_DN5035_c0_g1_i2.p1 TRINITY_DN5035_c0_g1~~TRINITY_DN5035_c0_g1_i2.p1  ORF type:complete len:817 (-),score=192.36 TRINITY_DN5035_c0_g1_i2:57-2507(-)
MSAEPRSKQPQSVGQFMFRGGPWYESLKPVKHQGDTEATYEQVEKLRSYALSIYEERLRDYETRKQTRNDSDSRWIQTVLKSGTTSDKLGALTLLIQENPFCNMRALDQLLGMAQKKSRREAEQSIIALKDLFVTNLLPDRKLMHFRNQPLMSKDRSDDHLLFWIFEEALKEKYGQFIQILEKGTLDAMEFFRSKMIHIILDLLKDKPEQEKALLAILVNKLGDIERKIASKIPYLLQLLLTKHPFMKSVVIREVEQLMFRKNLGQHGQYYGLIFLNQIVLSGRDSAVAQELVSLYFSMFKSFVKTRDFENKTLSAILTGVNRALPYSQLKADSLSEHIDSVFQIAHSENFNIAIQALTLLFQIAVSDASFEIRYFRTLYETLLRKDLATSSKQGLLLNLTYRSIKFDSNTSRKKAMLKRLLQVAEQFPTTFACSALFLTSEIMRMTPGLSLMITQPEDNEGQENYQDADKADSDNKSLMSEGTPNMIGYNPYKRDPQFAKAENSCLWELNKLAVHFHPTVAKWATFLLRGEVIKFDGDPLQDFQFMRFLDKFSYKTPKLKASDHGGSIMQYIRTAKERLPVGSAEFKSQSPSDIPEDELFFYNYFQEKASRISEYAKAKGAGESDDIGEENEDDDGVAEDNDEDKEEADDDADDEPGDDEDALSEGNEQDTEQDPEEGYGEEDLEDLLGDEELDEEIDFKAALLEDLSDDEDLYPEKKGKKRNREKGMLDKTPEFETSSTFASAEEFAHLLEDSAFNDEEEDGDNDGGYDRPRKAARQGKSFGKGKEQPSSGSGGAKHKASKRGRKNTRYGKGRR